MVNQCVTIMVVITVVSVAQAFAIIFTCWTIISGIDAWKREFIGKRRIELAEEALAKFFEVKDAIAYIRNPFARSDEGNTRQRTPGESDEEAELLNRGYVVVERYQKREKVFSDFQTVKYKFMAAFGTDSEEIFDETYKAVNSIFNAASSLARWYWNPKRQCAANQEMLDRRMAEQNTFEAIIWDCSDASDPIRQKIETAQQKLEAKTKPCFAEAMKTYTILTKKWWR